MDKGDSVQDNELLYRAVLNDGEQYTCQEDEITVESPAFKGEEPSVGRATLVNFRPALYLSLAKLDEKNGVVSLNTAVVREIELKFHTVDVIPDPKPGNCAHAKIIICSECEVTTSGRQKELSRLRHALADIATEVVAKDGWTLDPQE
jgi:hypothetical protein